MSKLTELEILNIAGQAYKQGKESHGKALSAAAIKVAEMIREEHKLEDNEYKDKMLILANENVKLQKKALHWIAINISEPKIGERYLYLDNREGIGMLTRSQSSRWDEVVRDNSITHYIPLNRIPLPAKPIVWTVQMDWSNNSSFYYNYKNVCYSVRPNMQDNTISWLAGIDGVTKLQASNPTTAKEYLTKIIQNE